MHKAGWHADRLDAPRQVPDQRTRARHPTPSRTYLLDDATVQATAEGTPNDGRHSIRCPGRPGTVPLRPSPEPQGRHLRNGNHDGAEEALWTALREALEQGATLGRTDRRDRHEPTLAL